MKVIPSLTSLLLLAATTAFGTTLPAPVKGNVGNVTIALTLAYAEGAFKDNTGAPTDVKNTSTATQTKLLLKADLKKARYSNKEFLTDLIAKGVLTGVASDWSLRYIEADYIEGFFAVRKNGPAVYLGGLRVDQDEPILIENVSGNVLTFSGNQTTTYKSAVKEDGNLKNFSYSYSETKTSTIALFLRPTADSDIATSGLRTRGYSSSINYTAATDKLTERYATGASSLSELVGDTETNEGDTAIATGAINISPLKETSDISIYVEAYPYAPLLDADAG
jgi:hypothetical protein